MIDNIEKVLSRGEALEKLVDRTEELADQSVDFKRGTKKLKNRMWWRNVIIVSVILFVILAIIFVIIWISCEFPSFRVSIILKTRLDYIYSLCNNSVAVEIRHLRRRELKILAVLVLVNH
jgi:hypothetical protein